jgi:hypothetical protein
MVNMPIGFPPVVRYADLAGLVVQQSPIKNRDATGSGEQVLFVPVDLSAKPLDSFDPVVDLGEASAGGDRNPAALADFQSATRRCETEASAAATRQFDAP